MGRYPNWLWLVGSALVLGLLAGFIFSRPFQTVASSPPPIAGVEPFVAPPPPPRLPGKRLTFLVMGVDKRPDDYGRSDSMIVVSYDPVSDQIAMLSLPRDTWTEIPGHGYDKVNHSYAFGGVKLAVASVQRLLGIPIDHYVMLSFKGFQRIVDAVGGLDIDAEKRMYYVDPFDLSMGPDGLLIDIQPGMQHMDGELSLKYARFRKDDEADIGRMRRQQQVITTVVKRLAEPGMIKRIPQLIPAVYDTVETDVTVGEMLRLFAGGKGALTNPLKAGALGGKDMEVGGIYYLMPNLVEERTTAYQLLVGGQPPADFLRRAKDDQAVYDRALSEALAAEPIQVATVPPKVGAVPPIKPAQPPVVKPQPITVSIVDGSGKKLAATYAKRLRAAGFRVSSITTSPKILPRTMVYDHAAQPGTEERIKSLLPGALYVKAKDTRAPVALEIMLGADLQP